MNPDYNPEARLTHEKLVRAKLSRGEAITPIEALNEFGCMRLSAVIFELKKQGMKIHTTIVKDGKTGKHYAQYLLQSIWEESQR